MYCKYIAISSKVVQQTRTRQCRKVLWVMGFTVLDWGFRCFSDIEGNSTNKCMYVFSFLVGKGHELQSINARLFVPIILIGIVAYAFTLLWSNLSQNSCMWNSTLLTRKQHISCPSKARAVKWWRIESHLYAGPCWPYPQYLSWHVVQKSLHLWMTRKPIQK